MLIFFSNSILAMLINFMLIKKTCMPNVYWIQMFISPDFDAIVPHLCKLNGKFPCFHTLILAHTNINKLSQINALASLKSLDNLHIQSEGKERFPYYWHIVTNQNLARQWLRSLFYASLWRNQMIAWHLIAPSKRKWKPNNQMSRSGKHKLSIKYQ